MRFKKSFWKHSGCLQHSMNIYRALALSKRLFRNQEIKGKRRQLLFWRSSLERPEKAGTTGAKEMAQPWRPAGVEERTLRWAERGERPTPLVFWGWTPEKGLVWGNAISCCPIHCPPFKVQSLQCDVSNARQHRCKTSQAQFQLLGTHNGLMQIFRSSIDTWLLLTHLTNLCWSPVLCLVLFLMLRIPWDTRIQRIQDRYKSCFIKFMV